MNKNFSNNLKKLRNNNNLSQKELAEKIYTSRSAVAKWEQGRGMPNIETLNMISHLFNVSIEDLLENKKNNRRTFKKLFFIALLILLIITINGIIYFPKKVTSYIDKDVENIKQIFIQEVNEKYYINKSRYTEIINDLDCVYVSPCLISAKSISSFTLYIYTNDDYFEINNSYIRMNKKSINYNVYNNKLEEIIEKYMED